MPDFAIHTEPTPFGRRIDVSGEIDLSTSPKLRQAVLQAFDEKGHGVLISLAQVRHIDSSGMATLVEGLRKAQDTGGRLMLTELDSHVQELFAMTHLNEIFEIVADREQAAERFSLSAAD